MRGALDVHRELLARDVPHEVVRLRGTVAADADDLPRALGLDPCSCVAVRVYVTDVGTVAVLVQAGAVPQPAALLSVLGARTLRPATADEVNAGTDYAAGLVSPVCLPAGVLLVADEALRAAEVLYCPVGEGGVALGIRSADLLAASGARVHDLAALPLPRGEREPWTRSPREGAGPGRVLDLDGRDAGAARQHPERYRG